MLMIITFTLNAVFNLIIGLLVAKFLGPADFGRYALAQSIGIVFNTICIDWLRHSVTRFYKGGDDNSYNIRASLELTLGISCVSICVIAAIGILCDVNFGLSLSLALLTPITGLTNGLFDYTTAMLRADFKNKPYARAIIVKNLSSIVLTLAGAAYFQSAAGALAGLCLSLIIALASIWKYIKHPKNMNAKASLKHIKTFAIYALPIMFANVLIQAIQLFNRTLLSKTLGFDATGQYSLAYDFGTRIMAGLGSALDIFLLQLAIKAEHDYGREGAKKQLSQNLGLIFAIMMPLCIGLWLVLPSFTHILVPNAFQSAFITIFQALLPGFFAYAMLFFAIHQVFFVSEKTWPLSIAAAIALLINITVVLALKVSDPIHIAHIQSLSMGAALIIGLICVVKILPISLPLRDLGSVILASALMVGATFWLKSWTPGFATFAVTALLGGLVYVSTLVAFNTAGLRTRLRKLIKQ
jgi:O-antigen/teichoic acid export membrane protein